MVKIKRETEMNNAPESVNVLVIIPARGGSKGLPRKNIKELSGKL